MILKTEIILSEEQRKTLAWGWEEDEENLEDLRENLMWTGDPEVGTEVEGKNIGRNSDP